MDCKINKNGNGNGANEKVLQWY
ncbi:hypothetical protein [Borrelia nietonii]|nr:hypothetical protein [Borrelia nietonii]